MRTKIATWLTGIFAVLVCINYIVGHFSDQVVYEDRMAFFWNAFGISAVYGLIVAGGSFIRYADDFKITDDEFAKIFQNGIIAMFGVGGVLMIPRTFCIADIQTCHSLLGAAIGMIQVIATVVLLGCGVWFIGKALLVGTKQPKSDPNPKEDEKKKKEAEQKELDRAVGELNRVKKEAAAKIAEASKKLKELGYGGGDGGDKKKDGGEKKDEKGSPPKESGN